MKHADSRPRVHIWTFRNTVEWSFGPCAVRRPADDHGDALNRAIAALGGPKPLVVIMEEIL